MLHPAPRGSVDKGEECSESDSCCMMLFGFGMSKHTNFFTEPKLFVRAWNQLVSKKTRYQPILQRTIETTDNALTRLRAKEMIGLLDTVGRLDGFDYALMLRTLDFIEVHSEEKMTVVFQSGIRITQSR